MIQKAKRTQPWPGDSLGKPCMIYEGVRDLDKVSIKTHARYVNAVSGHFHNVASEPGHVLGGLGCTGSLVGQFKKGETLTTGRLRLHDPNLWPDSVEQLVPFNILLGMKDEVLDWIGENITRRWTVLRYSDGEKDRMGLAFFSTVDAARFRGAWDEQGIRIPAPMTVPYQPEPMTLDEERRLAALVQRRMDEIKPAPKTPNAMTPDERYLFDQVCSLVGTLRFLARHIDPETRTAEKNAREFLDAVPPPKDR
jgi:hypothetical protein